MVYENMRSGQNIGRIKAAPNLVNICVDEIAQEEMKGRLYHCYKKEATNFKNVVELLDEMEKLYDKLHFPEASTKSRSFLKEKAPQQRETIPKVVEPKIVLEQKGTKGTFLVCVQYRQNATWQGSVLWAETKQEQYFRSALELLKLIDSAVTEDEDEIVEGGSHEK